MYISADYCFGCMPYRRSAVHSLMFILSVILDVISPLMQELLRNDLKYLKMPLFYPPTCFSIDDFNCAL